ncbi:hypothetical protein ACQJBY_018280 [Aegilops geniculata]
MGRQRRWSRAALVACLVLLAAACAKSARPGPLAASASEGLPASASVSASTDGGGGDGPRRSAFDVLVEGLVSIGLGRRWRAGDGVGLVDGDKRRVPTGPNPLHNR